MNALQCSKVILSFAPVCIVVCLCIFLRVSCMVGEYSFCPAVVAGVTVSLERAIVTGGVVEESWQQQKRSNS